MKKIKLNKKTFNLLFSCLTGTLLLASTQVSATTAASVLIQAEDYTGFSDTSDNNLGGQYRTDAVDIETTSDTGGGYNVGWIESGETLEYTLELDAGTYEVNTRVASAASGDYTLSIDGLTIASSSVSTNGWQAFETQTLGSITVTDNQHILTLTADSGNFNINWLNLELTAAAVPDTDNDGINDDIDLCADTPADTVVDSTGCIVLVTSQLLLEAEDYTDFYDSTIGNTGGEYRSDDVDIQITGDINGTYNVGWTAADEWLEYSVTLGAGIYNISTRVASSRGGASYELALDGNVFATDTVDSTGSWQSYETHNVGKITVQQGIYTLRLNVLNGAFNINWLQLSLTDDTGDLDNDGVIDRIDQCVDTPAGEVVSISGCPVLSSDDVTALFDTSTALDGVYQEYTTEALITRFGDRPRTRHAKESAFQSYDHYIAHYFEHRSSSIEIIDRVAMGGEGITLNVRTVWPISTQREGRIWYMGWGTLADYIDNSLMEIDTSRGDENGFDGTYYHYTKTVTFNPRKSPSNLSTAGDTALGNFSYDSPAIEVGDLMEFEISQFSGEVDGVAITGQTNYYGSTFLYVAGKGIVPWYLENPGEFVQYYEHFQEDSRELPEEYRLGGDTTAPYQYTDEPDNYFMQMALNIDYDKSQKFLEGRRVFHSSFNDGLHDEFDDNGEFEDVTGLIGAHHVNESCSGCHVRNGGSSVEAIGVPLDRWIFKVGDETGAPDAERGRVIQPSNASENGSTNGSGSGEGTVSIAQWTESKEGLRTPTYAFESGQPATFSARISPRLVGLGLLEAISEADIFALELAQSESINGVSGRVNLVSDPKEPNLTRIGRFGWKAGTVSVEHQVAGALNTDMGVKTSLLPELDCGSNQTNCNSAAQALDDTNLDNLVYYVQALAVRAQRGMESGVENTSIKAGKQVFIDTGCAECHTPSFQTSEYHPLVEVRDQAIQPYTDLLVHDMGDGLADNLAEGTVSGREWRTTPLWGLGLSMCVTNGVINPTGAEGDDVCNEAPGGTYLHDGRARTIEEAILWHGTNGSEALTSTNNYKALTDEHRTNLLNFLEAL
ncbi:di-heme oxidoredictase family protein [Colwellia sp. E2M01]|uniref:di-heme oxidoredictase family protein n=1 Tax=Colwellia sp. E2M01 TaxID=2841561 RepID=UPI001C0A35A2|nr:di-heme oxidoredictase family protein [Colwellia sp. E2M01]MBU2869589.1 carbohydrate-binding protein [Colwellia sp. E2M01]